MFKDYYYYYITKPGIIYGNSLSVIAGYLYVSQWRNLWLILPAVIGVGLIIGSACVFNNIIDYNIDALMTRTSNRALVVKTISKKNASIYAIALGICGVSLLYKYTNLLTIIIGIIGFIDYVLLYSYSKRHTHHATLIGSISGATPLVAGYTAYSNQLGVEAFILFAIMTFWQMPHFYAIALRRSDEYAKAKIPISPLAKSRLKTKKQIIVYILLFIIASISLSIFGTTGYIFAFIISIIGIYWLKIAIEGLTIYKDKKWAKKLFFYSLIVLLTLTIMLSIGSLIP